MRKMKGRAWAAAAVLSAVIFGCSRAEENGRLKVAAGIPPVAGLTEAIGGDRVEVVRMLPHGRTPHDFTPRTDTIRKSSGSALFFTTGMPFENKIAGFMKEHGRVCDVTKGIRRIEFSDGDKHGHRHDHDQHDHHDHGHDDADDGCDPHVWLSPKNALIMAENIVNELISADPAGAEYYRKNFALLRDRLSKIDEKISSSLEPYRGRTFFVYHPAFGYFADAYGLKQRAIELNGREAAPIQLAQIIREAKEEKVSTIFVQEQFNPGSAQALARQIGGSVAPLDPLAENLTENFEKIAEALLEGFRMGKK